MLAAQDPVTLAPLTLATLLPLLQAAAIDPARHVAVVANAAAPGSLELAQEYARRRGVPPERVVSLRAGTEEVTSRASYREQIEAPLRAFLQANPDVFVLVPTRGVPLKIEEDEHGPPPDESTFGRVVQAVDAAAVDRELELLRAPPPALAGWHESPVWRRERPLGPGDGALIVMRLDGPDLEVARGLIDRARHGELYGVEGTHLLDTRGLRDAQDGYAVYDEELRRVAAEFERAKVPLARDDEPGVVDLSGLTRPGHVWAWYGGRLEAARPFRFAPGAVACHVHSFSADTVRASDRNWVGPLLAHGATVAIGTVYEPLTAGFPTAPLFWRLFLEGAAVGDALTRANRYTSWMAVYVGDPLYAPYAPAVRAGQAARRALALDGPYRLARLLDQEDLAGAAALASDLAALDVPLEAAPDPRPLVREARGRVALGRRGKGSWEELVAACSAAEAALVAGEPKEAREAAEEALARSGTSFEANLLLARARLLLGEGKPALAAVRLARQVDPHDPQGRWLEVEALLACGEAKEALPAAEALGDPALVGRALAGLARWEEAAARLSALPAPDPAAALALGRALLELDRPAEAAATLRRALDRALPPTPGALPAWEALLEPWAVALARARDPAAGAARTTARAARRVPRPSRKQAHKAAEEARALLARATGSLPEPPARPSPGPARVAVGSRRLEPARLLLLGPTALVFDLPAARGGATPTRTLSVPAGQYRLVLVEGAGANLRVRSGTLRATLDHLHGLGLDAGDAWFVPE